VVVPPVMPVTIPVGSMVAAAGLLLVHVPVEGTSVRVVWLPWHSVNVPEIAAGDWLTVTTFVAEQPAGNI